MNILKKLQIEKLILMLDEKKKIKINILDTNGYNCKDQKYIRRI